MLKPEVEQEARSFIEHLAQKEFDSTYVGIEFDGPFEDEDFGATVLLKRRLENRGVSRGLARIMWEADKRGWDIPMDWEIRDK